MAKQVCVVTGASSGIGFEIARGLARTGRTVVMVGRDPERTEKSSEAVRTETGNDRVTSIRADFSSFSEARRVADEVEDEHDALHVLVNNAGVWHPDVRLSTDGYEDTIAVNHLAPFILTNLLLDLMKRSAPGRIVNVSSRLHSRPWRFDFDLLKPGGRYAGIRAYAQSKAANVLFTRELARRLDGTGVVANAVHPGDVAATTITRDSRMLSWGAKIVSPLMDTPEEGARGPLRAAIAPELEGVSGAYFHKCSERRPGRVARDDIAARRLWETSAEITGVGR